VGPVALAAVQAVREAGTEVSGTAVGGQPGGPRGRWAMLLRRHRRPVTDRSELAEATEAADTSVGEDGAAKLPARPEHSGPKERDEAHIPGAAAPQ